MSRPPLLFWFNYTDEAKRYGIFLAGALPVPLDVPLSVILTSASEEESHKTKESQPAEIWHVALKTIACGMFRWRSK